MQKFNEWTIKKYLETKQSLKSEQGDFYVDKGVMIIAALVIGLLVLMGIYKLWGDNIMPGISGKINQMFNYGG